VIPLVLVMTALAWPSGWMLVGAVMSTVGLVCASGVPISAMRVEAIHTIYDRHVPRMDARPVDEEWLPLRRHLTLHCGGEVDARLIELGLDPLDHFLELRLDLGIARHNPEQARRSIASLLENPGMLDNTTCRALEMLERELANAARHDARFCLLPIGAWSGPLASRSSA
jgi:hypothetical protein